MKWISKSFGQWTEVEISRNRNSGLLGCDENIFTQKRQAPIFLDLPSVLVIQSELTGNCLA